MQMKKIFFILFCIAIEHSVVAAIPVNNVDANAPLGQYFYPGVLADFLKSSPTIPNNVRANFENDLKSFGESLSLTVFAKTCRSYMSEDECFKMLSALEQAQNEFAEINFDDSNENVSYSVRNIPDAPASTDCNTWNSNFKDGRFHVEAMKGAGSYSTISVSECASYKFKKDTDDTANGMDSRIASVMGTALKGTTYGGGSIIEVCQKALNARDKCSEHLIKFYKSKFDDLDAKWDTALRQKNKQDKMITLGCRSGTWKKCATEKETELDFYNCVYHKLQVNGLVDTKSDKYESDCRTELNYTGY